VTDEATSCVETAAGPVAPDEEQAHQDAPAKEIQMATARVGQAAPDFELNAHIEGGFRNVKLSDYRGKWVVLCFYPGDFTFV
jgi:hypothetical protein